MPKSCGWLAKPPPAARPSCCAQPASAPPLPAAVLPGSTRRSGWSAAHTPSFPQTSGCISNSSRKLRGDGSTACMNKHTIYGRIAACARWHSLVRLIQSVTIKTFQNGGGQEGDFWAPSHPTPLSRLAGQLCISTHVHACTYMHMHAHASICMHIHTHACTCMHMHAHAHTYIHKHACACIAYMAGWLAG